MFYIFELSKNLVCPVLDQLTEPWLSRLVLAALTVNSLHIAVCVSSQNKTSPVNIDDIVSNYLISLLCIYQYNMDGFCTSDMVM